MGEVIFPEGVSNLRSERMFPDVSLEMSEDANHSIYLFAYDLDSQRLKTVLTLRISWSGEHRITTYGDIVSSHDNKFVYFNHRYGVAKISTQAILEKMNPQG